MASRFTLSHLVLVVAIVGVFALRYLARLDLPSWLFFGISVMVMAGAVYSFLSDYRRSGQTTSTRTDTETLRDPHVVQFLFNDVRSAPLWLVLRLYLGLQWLDSGWGKVTGDGWMDGGSALRSFWERVVAVPEPPARAAITYGWYRDFLQFMLDNEWYTWFAKVIATGEVLIGIALILGVFIGLAAAGGLMMNTAFMLAGTASTNPVRGAIAILIILGWKVAGHWGLDRYVLPALGTPWGRPVESKVQIDPNPNT
jgi:thiosulfate dehydrogenase [quinone] large subunit